MAVRRKLQGADCDWVKIWQKVNAKPFEHIVLKTKTVAAEATVEGIKGNKGNKGTKGL